MEQAENLVSMIIPTYNRSKLLRRAVESVLAQTYRPLELVVVDDGSSDDTPAVLESLRPAVEAAGVKATFVRKPNGGLGRARQAGVEASSGRWFGWLDDDDTIASTKTAKQVARLLETGADACCCYLTHVTATGRDRHPSGKKTLLTGLNPAAYLRGTMYAHINSMLIRRDLFAAVGEFDPDLRLSQDVEWCARLAHIATFCAVEEELGVWDYNPGAATRVNSIDDLIRRDGFQEQVCLRMRDRNQHRPNWDQQAWIERVARDFDQFVKHILYAGRIPEARQKWELAMQATGGHPILSRTRRKIRKARWLALLGLRLQHPKFESLKQIRQ